VNVSVSARATTCGTRSINRRRRRTRRQVAELEQAILAFLEGEHPATVRQVFYGMAVRGVVPKTEAGYRAIVNRLTQMRRAGRVPYGWVADSTRWMRKPASYAGLHEFLSAQQAFYRRSVWHEQPVYAEVWCEKDALAGVLFDVTSEYDVPLMVTRGYGSLSFLHGAGEVIAAVGRPAYLYYFGDYDPSGVDIARVTEQRLREFAPHAEIHFARVAVTPGQIERWNLPTRPTKQSDTRARRFRGRSVELDAIPPDRLRDLVRGCIERHIRPDELERLREIEWLERETLGMIAVELGNNGQFLGGDGDWCE